MNKNFAVLGSPISHSKSPAIHAAAYRRLGLDWNYGRFELTVSELEPFLRGRDETWRGFSVTMPLKEEAFRLVRTRTDIATRSGVVNTLIRDGRDWVGTNTDVDGLLMALQSKGCHLDDTLVLGSGATAVSAVLAAKRGGAQRVRVLARRLEAAEAIAGTHGCEAGHLNDPLGKDLPTTVISTLPGAAGTTLSVDPALTEARLFDVAYDPWPSPLTLFWRQHGGTSDSGIDMLIFQALLQIRWFLHRDPEAALPDEAEVVAAMRAAARI